MNKEIINWLNSIILNDFLSPLEKMYRIGIILSYEINDDNIYNTYYKYYEDLIWSRIQLIETFDYDNKYYFQENTNTNTNTNEEKCAW